VFDCDNRLFARQVETALRRRAEKYGEATKWPSRKDGQWHEEFIDTDDIKYYITFVEKYLEDHPDRRADKARANIGDDNDDQSDDSTEYDGDDSDDDDYEDSDTGDSDDDATGDDSDDSGEDVKTTDESGGECACDSGAGAVPRLLIDLTAETPDDEPAESMIVLMQQNDKLRAQVLDLQAQLARASIDNNLKVVAIILIALNLLATLMWQ
jgi:hypothetical protein